MSFPDKFSTKRLSLRKTTDKDSHILSRLFDDEIMSLSYLEKSDSLSKKKYFSKYLKFINENGYSYAIFHGNVLIGEIQLIFQNGKWKIGYWISKGKRNKGYGFEALSKTIEVFFENINDYLYAGCWEINTPSKKILEKCGFNNYAISENYSEYYEKSMTSLWYEIKK